MTITVKRLSSGYWHARLGSNRFVQWQTHEAPRDSNVFGWPLSHEEWTAVHTAVRDETRRLKQGEAMS